MKEEWVAPRITIVVCLMIVVLAAAPYFVLDGTALGVYYDAPIVGPPVIAIFALVAIVILGSAVADRSDHETVAGAVLVLGLTMAVLTAIWTVSVPESIVGSLSDVTALEHHRWALLLTTLFVPAITGWYARTVL